MRKERLFFQFYKAIERCFSPKVDKHSYKKQKCQKVKIFSYEDRRNIIKVADQLSKFIESNFPEVTQIKDINSQHINKFFIEKSKNCSINTLKNYKYCLTKLEKMIRQELHLNITYIDNIKLKSKNKDMLRDIELNSEHIDIILRECETSKSNAVVGVKFAIYFGLRVSEVCKLQGRDINIEKGVLSIVDSKGKRSRSIKIQTKEQKKLCESIKNYIDDRERICKMREDSVNTFIRRLLLKNNITIYNKKKTGIHAIRKHYAKIDYTNNLEKTNSKKEAWEQTSLNLGHNKDRKSLFNTYVKY